MFLHQKPRKKLTERSFSGLWTDKTSRVLQRPFRIPKLHSITIVHEETADGWLRVLRQILLFVPFFSYMRIINVRIGKISDEFVYESGYPMRREESKRQ